MVDSAKESGGFGRITEFSLCNLFWGSASSVQFSRSVVSDSLWPHESQHTRPPCPSPTLRVYSNSRPLSRWCHPTTSACCRLLLPSLLPSIRIFSKESVLCIRWPKYWSFSFSISTFREYSGLISFRNDWFDLLAIQEILKSLLQHHSSKASIFWHSAFFTVLRLTFLISPQEYLLPLLNMLLGSVCWLWKCVLVPAVVLAITFLIY